MLENSAHSLSSFLQSSQQDRLYLCPHPSVEMRGHSKVLVLAC